MTLLLEAQPVTIHAAEGCEHEHVNTLGACNACGELLTPAATD